MPSLPEVYLARHGETAWSVSGQHTGLTDLPLTEQGEVNAARLGERLRGLTFDRVFVSPLARARLTCELAGFAAVAVVDEDLVEWNYGDYEGRTTAEIRALRPDWQLFRDGCPGGEALADIQARARRVVDRLRSQADRSLIFSSGHFLRVLTVSWLGLELRHGVSFHLDTASLSMLGYEHTFDTPTIRLWNETQL